MNTKAVRTICVAVLTVGAIGGSAQAGIVIDDFSDYMTPVAPPAAEDPRGGWTIYPTSAGQTYVETGLSGVAGGTRETNLWANHAAPDVAGGAYMQVSGNDFSLANGGASWNTVALAYDSGGAGLDLDASEGTKFWAEMRFDHLGLGQASILSMTVVDGQAHTAMVTRTWNNFYNPGVDYLTYSFLFSEFAGIDFSEIDSVTLYYSSDLGNDYTIRLIASDIVPEPATMSLVALGLAGLMLRRKGNCTRER